ncbi:hypothetical protein AMELA_G00115180 [Ameiurus melas]|uniref:Uncharacterized protein n=1 Tax=Ameiurus melas TaxID=219545 RepID=A0A7J6AR47_AMEME|nr:hypothetical protein AMELA_G00115180 [Ameiurus melas]
MAQMKSNSTRRNCKGLAAWFALRLTCVRASSGSNSARSRDVSSALNDARQKGARLLTPRSLSAPPAAAHPASTAPRAEQDENQEVKLAGSELALRALNGNTGRAMCDRLWDWHVSSLSMNSTRFQ